MSEQIAVRMSDELARSLEGLVRGGRYVSKAEAVRTAVEELVDRERRRLIGEQIVDGYRRTPQTDDELADVMEAGIRSSKDEPW
jgi:Arc/MetJ-type ribon-helix-helix transcriptional regulator